MNEPKPEFISPRDLSIRLGVSKRTVLRWIQLGRIKANRYGPQMIRIPAKEAERLLRG